MVLMPTISRAEAVKRGYPTDKWFLQTILFNKRMSKKQAVDWLNKHGHSHNYYRTITNFHRFMQNNPVRGATYFTQMAGPNVELVFQRYS